MPDKKGSQSAGVGGRPDPSRASAGVPRRRARLLLLLCLAASACVFASVRLAPASPAAAARVGPAPAQEGGVTKFSHSIPRHAELS
ncbi:MAG TPA: hypothetical protein VF611_03630, partial [Pyrinomonadaceae bacterium]